MTARRSARTAVVLIGTAVIAMTTSPIAAAQPPGSCGEGPWGARVQGGPPGFEGGDRAGDYLWHDDSGFHLRVTHRGDRRDVFTGTLISPTPLRIAPVQLEAADHADLSPDGRTLWFSFTDYGHVDGIDFVTDCADHLDIGPLSLDGVPLPPERVYLGANEIHPDRVPFGVARH